MTRRQRMVQHLKNTNGEWNIKLINKLFHCNLAKEICNIFWANNEEEDKLLWMGNINDIFSVKFFYWMDNWSGSFQSSWWGKMWNSKIHERQKFLIWKIAHKGLSLKLNLARRGVIVNDTMCLHSCCHEEDDVHVFFNCHFARGLWFTSPSGIRRRN